MSSVAEFCELRGGSLARACREGYDVRERVLRQVAVDVGNLIPGRRLFVDRRHNLPEWAERAAPDETAFAVYDSLSRAITKSPWVATWPSQVKVTVEKIARLEASDGKRTVVVIQVSGFELEPIFVIFDAEARPIHVEACRPPAACQLGELCEVHQ